MRIKVSLIAMAALALVSIGSAQQGQGGQAGGRRQGGGQRGYGGGGAQRLTQLLRNEQVQAELKVTDDQKTKIEALPRPQRGGGGGGGGGPRTAPTAEEMAKQLTDDKVATSAILTPEQEKRLEEIRIQWAGPTALTLPEVQEGLGLTADQKTKLAELQTKMREATRGMREKAQNGEIDQADVPAMIEKNNDIMKAEVAKVLTPDQNAKLKAMGGAELKQETRRPGGGRNG